MIKTKRANEDTMVFMKKIAKLQHRIDQLNQMENFLIFGAGQHTRYVLSCCILPPCNVRICDNFQEGSLFGYRIEKPSKEITQWADTILISGFEKKDEMLESLRKYDAYEKGVLLYTSEDKSPIYLSDVELDADRLNLCSSQQYGSNKYSLWDRNGAGAIYEQSVEKDFFSAVTQNYYLDYIHSGDKVLDIGAGTGRLSMAISRHGGKVTSVDTSRSMLEELKKKSREIQTVLVQNEKLPFSDESFDVVTSCDAMIHFLNWDDFLREHARVLKPGGFIIYNFYNDDHLKRISTSRRIRSSYIAGGNDYYATISQEELKNACQKLQLDLVKLIPYGYFLQTAYSYGILTRSEMFDLENFYSQICRAPEARNVVREFEQNVVSKLSPDATALNICVIRKPNA